MKGLAAEDARERRKSGSPGLRPSTTTLPRRLDAFLEAPADDDLEAIGKRGCTGCVRCKHEGGGKCKKQRHVHGCEACGTESAGASNATARASVRFTAPRTYGGWIRSGGARKATEGYVGGSFQRAAKAYAKQASIAAAALPRARDVAGRAPRRAGGGSFSRLAWTRRPDTAAVSEILALCDIPDRRAREKKLLPVLLEWDHSSRGGDRGAVRGVGVYRGIDHESRGAQRRRPQVAVPPRDRRGRSERGGQRGEVESAAESEARGGEHPGRGARDRSGRRRPTKTGSARLKSRATWSFYPITDRTAALEWG